MGKYLIFIGFIIMLAGVLWIGGERLGLGRLPGDLVFKGEKVKVYFPIVTSIVISIVLSLIFWLFRNLRG